jgi:hypothetical protein
MTDLRFEIPVALFAYARADLLRRTLECLREDRVPLLYAFSDAPANEAHQGAVGEVREMLRSIDWCELRLTERRENLGLGRSILSGVGSILEHHGEVIVFEDDLICVPGTYDYLAAALTHYRDDDRVGSITAWTHPRITPGDIGDRPYFDGRAECWVWGTWARTWSGMRDDAMALVRECERQGIDVHEYGDDLLPMAEREREQNIWAVRFLYLHILNRTLCLRPPWSMVEHLGFDERATNAADATAWANPPLRPAPPIPAEWPDATLHPDCAALQRRAFEAGAGRGPLRAAWERVHRVLKGGG